ncbi:tyrosine-type recombinase/integrase [Cohnella sp.]|uniref:tyrosine-type recombinase/integrase n=1 Tax=Cohnella sp. TaxID=1883426 RepID=UPI0035672A21
MSKKSSEIQPLLESQGNLETQESFRQNFSFAEKILALPGIFPPSSDDHDIRKVTRRKVEDMLFAEQHVPKYEDAPTKAHLGPQAINLWIWENKVMSEIPEGLLREFLGRGMNNTPHVFFRKYRLVHALLADAAKFHAIAPAQVRNEHLLDPKTLRTGIHSAADKTCLSPFHFLMRKSIQAGILDKPIPYTKATAKQPSLHPRILSFQTHMEEKGFARKHIRNNVNHIHQLLIWLCANIRIFEGSSPDILPIFQIQNEHLLAYRTYRLKLIKEGFCSRITFTHSIYAIRAFYRFLRDRYGYAPPIQRFRAISAPRYSPRDIPTNDQINELFQIIAQYAKNPTLDLLGYRFMLDLGLRLSEVAKIKWNDLNLGTRTIVIHSKGKKNHVMPLAGELYTLLKKVPYPPATTYLFGEKPSMIKYELYENFKLYTLIAGWPFPGGVHLFRHIFITRLAYKGNLPQAIQSLSRVKMLNTIGLYIHLANHDEHMISQINKLNYE